MAHDDVTSPHPHGKGSAHHEPHAVARVLTDAIEKGKSEVPNPAHPLVCKPIKLESWRIFKILTEFVDGFSLLRKYGLAVTFFGSARRTLEPKVYADATLLASRLAKAGFAVITGGSLGIMEAANKGAYEAGGSSVGLNIHLPDEQRENPYLTDHLEFDHFFVRKVMLTFASEVYIYFPGGFGTMDELFEIITLIQTKKIRPLPIVLYDKKYWEPLVAFMRDHLVAEWKTIDPHDLDLFVVVDSVDEAYEYIMSHVKC